MERVPSTHVATKQQADKLGQPPAAWLIGRGPLGTKSQNRTSTLPVAVARGGTAWCAQASEWRACVCTCGNLTLDTCHVHAGVVLRLRIVVIARPPPLSHTTLLHMYYATKTEAPTLEVCAGVAARE